MPCRVFLAWAVLLASCVDLTLPPELRHPNNGSPDQDASDDDSVPPVPETGPVMSDGGGLTADAPTSSDPDADPPIDAPDVDAAPVPPDLAADKLPVDAPLRTNGNACTAGAQCQSGLCVD